ncbi:MAG: class I tRNA ligase family protein [Bifidobacterium sp.]|nr:class I tRNA ligase family protein [Bifidobacterium sp.]
MTNDVPSYRYTAALAASIEKNWQSFWLENGTFHAPNPVGDLATESSDGTPSSDAAGANMAAGGTVTTNTAADGTAATSTAADATTPAASANRIFVQDMFPYPSGVGLHVGHPLGYIATDVFARYHRMLGANVLHALGYDAYGLPAEQYAVQTGTHPRTTTEANIENMKRQIGRLGLGHDPRRSFATTDEDYYRWTQWIFLQIFNSWFDPEQNKARPIAELEARLNAGEVDILSGPGANDMDPETRAVIDAARANAADPATPIYPTLTRAQRDHVLETFRLVYRSRSLVNWCPGLGTVLANEEVTAEGRSERGNFPVFRKQLTQWMMRITAYSDRLLDDLDTLDWPEKVKSMQRNWIGRSRGAEVDFTVTDAAGQDHTVTVFTTRPDTLFGAEYMVLAPEHDLVDTIATSAWPADFLPGHANLTLSEQARDLWTAGEATPAEAIAAYRRTIAAKSDLERQENKEKTGVFTGAFATNPVSGKRIPVFIADYVLMGYGTGAIMAVPAHDTRDFDFARAFELPITQVVAPKESMDGTAGETAAAANNANTAGETAASNNAAATAATNAAGETPAPLDEAFTHAGVAVNSANDKGLDINGLPLAEGKAAIIAWLEANGCGTEKIQYKLRDWLFARQRYWGEPFPVVYDENDVAHPLPESMLPVLLPEVEDYRPVSFDPDDADSEPQPPLAKATEWVNVELDLGDGPKMYRRDTNVMPQWAGSSWYELRYTDPHNQNQLCDPVNERYWMGPREGKVSGGVDLYVGGVEHAVLHLLYSRFWHKVLFDLGHVSSFEPYHRLFNQGYIQAFAYTDSRGVYIPAAEVVERDGSYWWKPTDGRDLTDPRTAAELNEHGEIPVNQEYGKMGKSLKNAVSPDEICDDYGADTLRVYEMAMGPLDTSRPWATKDVVGAHRFLQRLWRLVVDENSGELVVTDNPVTDEDLRALHRTVAAVRENLAELMDNTAVAKLIEYVNYLTKTYPQGASRELVEPAVLMVAPLAPHIAEELWSRLGHTESLAHGPFPTFEEKWLVDDSIEIPVQIKGKVRSRVTVPADISQADLEAAALADERIQELIAGQSIRKVIVIPGRMVNIVV